jgi:peptidoglycan/LPS O-acetylase OafA/YrhL
MFLAAVFGLGPLFVVGGWLASVSLARHGPGHFLRSRLLRLGVPVLVYLVLIDPVADYLGARAEGQRLGLGHYLWEVRGDRDLGPMWFVVALLVFSLGYAAWRAVRPAGPARSVLTGRVLAVLALVIAVADFGTWLRWPYLEGTPWNLDLQHWPQAAGLFVLGVLAGEHGWFRRLPAGAARRCGWLTLSGLAALLVLAGYSLLAGGLTAIVGGWHWPTAAFAVLDGATAVVLAVWIVGWFQNRWNGPPRRVTAAAGRASYAAYFLHPLVLVGLSIAVHGLPWPPEVKFLIVAAVGVPASFAVGHLATRTPGVNRIV